MNPVQSKIDELKHIATNKTINLQLLALVDAQTRDEILLSVANHYGITKVEALEEVSHDEAQQLLDYLAGNTRIAISILMRRHGFAAG